MDNILIFSLFLFVRKISFSGLGIVLLFPAVAMAEKLLAPEQIEGVIRVTAEDVYELVVEEPELVIIDSRKKILFDKGHIQGAHNILDSNMTEQLLMKYVSSTSVPILFYCNGDKCLRSANASIKAHAWGYSRIYWFRGGWTEWLEKKMPVSQVK